MITAIGQVNGTRKINIERFYLFSINKFIILFHAKIVSEAYVIIIIIIMTKSPFAMEFKWISMVICDVSIYCECEGHLKC